MKARPKQPPTAIATPDQIADLMRLRGWTAGEACRELSRACYVHPRSVERWIQNGCKRADPARRILAMLDAARKAHGGAI